MVPVHLRDLQDCQSMDNMDVHLFKCSACSLVSTHRSILVTHHKENAACRNANAGIVETDCVASFPTTVTCAYIPKTRPGPKPVDSTALFKGRLAAFDEESEEKRIEYFLEKEGLVDYLVARQSTKELLSLPVKFYQELWGVYAPKHFQSIVAMSKKYLYVERVDDRGEIYVEESSKPDFEKEVMVRLFEFMRIIFDDIIPKQRKELTEHAELLCFNLIDKNIKGVTYLDIIQNTDTYARRKKDIDGTRFKYEAQLIKNNIAAAMNRIGPYRK